MMSDGDKKNSMAGRRERAFLRDFTPRGARFRRETPVGPCIADCALLSARSVIEIDGDSHEAAEGKKYDGQRDACLNRHGFTVIRFDNDRIIYNPNDVFLAIEQQLAPILPAEAQP